MLELNKDEYNLLYEYMYTRIQTNLTHLLIHNVLQSKQKSRLLSFRHISSRFRPFRESNRVQTAKKLTSLLIVVIIDLWVVEHKNLSNDVKQVGE